MARKVSLTVNGNPIELNPFVEGYVYYIAAGILNSLKDTKPIKKLDFDVDSDGLVTIVLNGDGVSVNVFVMEIVRNTLAGMVSNLKGVDEQGMNTFSLRVSQ
jgi:hypothetical protein